MIPDSYKLNFSFSLLYLFNVFKTYISTTPSISDFVQNVIKGSFMNLKHVYVRKVEKKKTIITIAIYNLFATLDTLNANIM